MNTYIFLMHDDATTEDDDAWSSYLDALIATGRFAGGSAIGDGACFRKGGPAPPINAKLGGYLKIEARDLADARSLLVGNPVYEGGGTVEIRELPRT